eukprot:2924734-Prymnesium_polylepis.1
MHDLGSHALMRDNDESTTHGSCTLCTTPMHRLHANDRETARSTVDQLIIPKLTGVGEVAGEVHSRSRNEIFSGGANLR